MHSKPTEEVNRPPSAFSANRTASPVSRSSRKQSTRRKTLSAATPAKPQNLQLWVEHSLNISARSAILISKCNSNHAIAQSDQSTASISTMFSQLSKRSPLGLLPTSRLVISRDYQERASLRNVRKQKQLHIARKEQHDQLERDRRVKRASLEAAAEAARRKALAEEQERTRTAQAKAQAEKEAKAKKAQRRVHFAIDVEEKASTVPPRPPTAAGTQNDGAARNAIVPIVGTAPAKKEQGVATTGGTQKAEQEHMPFATRALKTWEEVCSDARDFRSNSSMAPVRRNVNKGVNLAVNQVAASIKQVSLKVNDLSQLIVQAKQVGGGKGESFAMKAVAERLIGESDFTVALSQTTAFAVASVIVGVTAKAQDVERMKDVFLGAFYQHCAYTMPSYIRKGKEESIAEFRKRLGYKEDESGEGYLERMCGCVNLFAAVLQTEDVFPKVQFGPAMSNPFSLDVGWSWLARIVNREQRAITPAMVFAFLELGGYAMSRRYKKQFAKLMAMIQRAVVLKVNKSAPKGPTSRLDVFISEYIEAGCTVAEPPKGRKMPQSDAEFL